MRRLTQDRRGLALIMSLLVVALLTVSVVEFFFSTEIDSRMVRNSLLGLQASQMARSGVAVGEALLLEDLDHTVDSFLEEWCPMVGREGRACLIEDGAGRIMIPPGMRLRVEIWDESGKVNVNWTKPSLGEIRSIRSRPENMDLRNQPCQWWTDVLGRLLQGRGGNPELAPSLEAYWRLVWDSYDPPTGMEVPGGLTGTGGSAGQEVTPGPGGGSAAPGITARVQPPDLAALEDLMAATGGQPIGDLRRLRGVLAALPYLGAPRRVNLNSVSREVLAAIEPDPAKVDNILTTRLAEPIRNPAGLLSQRSPENPAFGNPASMVGATSSVFRIRASAIVNFNPMTGRGGIGRSADMVVRRVWTTLPMGQGGVRNQPANPASPGRFTLRRLYWQKEGGAVLFRPESEAATDELSDSSF